MPPKSADRVASAAPTIVLLLPQTTPMDATNLRMLIELAITERDAAATRRAQAAQQLMQARGQLDTLKAYARDYDRRAQATLTQGCDIAVQSNLRAFVAKLERAVEQQGQEVQRREKIVAAADAELTQAQRKLKSLQALDTRRRDGERQVAERREQKTMDELARHVPRLSPLANPGW
jgi:flagellar protein FliJ